MPSAKQPWIQSPLFDLLLIVGPPLFASGVVLVFSERLGEMGPWAWLLLVLGVDVAHVYSALFRTYFDPALRTRYLLWVVPTACWTIGAVLYSLGPAYFWTGLAYLAVFHFVRQQYGFVMIYGRDERSFPAACRWLDRVVIYAATFYPLLYWHTHEREFSWLIDGDFLRFDLPWLAAFGLVAYALVIAAYVAKEIWIVRRFRRFNLPRNLLVFGTAASWSLGIVLFNNDLAFTLTNVVSHGIPYIALIWIYGRRTDLKVAGRAFFSWRMVPAFVGVLLVLAYFEEGLWDGFVWRDHPQFFPHGLPELTDKVLLTLLVPILALPQASHYVFDAFLWRSQGAESEWKHILPRTESFT